MCCDLDLVCSNGTIHVEQCFAVCVPRIPRDKWTYSLNVYLEVRGSVKNNRATSLIGDVFIS